MPAAARHTALVVDDEPDVCRITARMLDEAGFAVKLATSGPEALAKLPDSVDVIVLDVRMPGMSGVEVAREARRLGTTAPVLFVSGFPENPAAGPGQPRHDFLFKPFTPDQLVEAVRTLLTAAA
jgi:CheY-like chemotaxis protein